MMDEFKITMNFRCLSILFFMWIYFLNFTSSYQAEPTDICNWKSSKTKNDESSYKYVSLDDMGILTGPADNYNWKNSKSCSIDLITCAKCHIVLTFQAENKFSMPSCNGSGEITVSEPFYKDLAKANHSFCSGKSDSSTFISKTKWISIEYFAFNVNISKFTLHYKVEGMYR